MGKAQRSTPTDDWHQLELLITFPEQRTYELIRPVVLFGTTPAERAQQTGAAPSTIYRQAKRFATEGMLSLSNPVAEAPRPRLPLEIQQFIANLKAQHPPLYIYEISTICYIRFGRRPGASAIKRAFAEVSLEVTTRRFPPFHATPEPVQRRVAIIRLYMEGWNAKSIALYLQTSRETVHVTLRRWAHEGVCVAMDRKLGWGHAPM